MQLLKSNEYVKVDGDRFDVLKFILSLFVVGLHIDFFYPLTHVFRVAVPLFFIMTSYFFFLKQNTLESQQAKKQELIKYCKRILKLYLFWFVLLLPLTIYYHKWHEGLDMEKVLVFVRSFFFGSTFRASWFLMASMMNIALVWYFSRKVKMGVLFAISIVLYIFCCMTSNYFHLCERIPYFTEFYNGYTTIFDVPCNSFPVALIFVLMGKYLADHEICVSNKLLIWTIVILSITCFMEFYFAWSHRYILSGDSYFSLPLMCLAIFMLIGQNYVAIKGNTKNLRKYSTIIFCSHFSFGTIILMMLKEAFGEILVFSYDISVILTFIITVVICLLLCKLLLWLEKKPHFGWVRYSH